MTWPPFPKRLQSALKALGCLAENDGAMLSQEIAKQIGVPDAETAKVLQLLVWGGFVTSRRGSKGGFHLAINPDRITMGEVIDFFMTRHPAEPEGDAPVLRVLRECIAPAEKKFGKLSLASFSKTRSGKPLSRATEMNSQMPSRGRVQQQKDRP
jgi:Rrf2 family protein